ncbi:MAG TPA: O-antigen ligase family protein [Cryomorphaceae bacterium]|nr:O-antigen ligase family protein [Cryomorphaceae bacterium]
MLRFLSENKGAILLFLVWFVIGRFSAPAFYVVAGLSLIMLWRKLMFLELLMGFLFILILSDTINSTTDFAKAFKNIYILALAAIAVIERKRFPKINRIYFYFLPFIVAGLIGMLQSPIPFLAVQKTLSYILLIFIVPQFVIKAYDDHGTDAIRSIIFFAAFMILMGFVLELADPGYTYARGGRFRGVFGNPNGLGIFASLVIALVYLARDIYPNLFAKNDLRWLIIPALVSLVLAGSRTSIIAVIIFFVFTRLYRVSPVIGFMAFLGTAIVSELIASNLVSIISSLGLSEFFRVDTLEGGSGREIAWQLAWQTIQDNFWFGRGFAFDEWIMAKNQEALNDLGHQGGVHNTYLQIWLNTGIVGLLLFLRAIFLNVIKGASRSRLAFPFLWLVMFSILPESWLAASLNPFSILFFIGLTILTDNIFTAEVDEEEKSQTPALV